MRLVNYPSGHRESKTFWCPKCDRFAVTATSVVPKCPVHNVPMLDDPAHPSRVEANAEMEDKSRRPPPISINKTEDILRLTGSLEQIVSNSVVPVVANREDYDIRELVMTGLLLRNVKAVISDPSPRYRWGGYLDPNWDKTFKQVLGECDMAVYARRPLSLPNPATRFELDTLHNAAKNVFIFEFDPSQTVKTIW